MLSRDWSIEAFNSKNGAVIQGRCPGIPVRELINSHELITLQCVMSMIIRFMNFPHRDANTQTSALMMLGRYGSRGRVRQMDIKLSRTNYFTLDKLILCASPG